uniref:MBT domain-containing protein 1-like n=1 Tax=Phallusia mammillata TaxID=59560 RepID=A0A6F9DJM6_9ASCI|nr:MBT domain-containing protein 1-like [Phallusia mammillata]
MDTSKQTDAKEIAICESCGQSGDRESFYSTTKRFCGAHCAHSYSARHRRQHLKATHKTNNSREVPKKKKKLSISPNKSPSPDPNLPLVLPSEMERREYSSQGFDWGKHLVDNTCDAVPVHLFPHAQMSSHWTEIDKGMKVEVLNLDCPVPTKVYWIAQVVQVAGYKALLRYEGFGDEEKCDFWCNLCTHDVHAVGWCATIGKPLVPPKTIQFKYSNWKTFLVQRLTGAKTLPNDFQQRVVQSMNCPFMVNMRLEVMDKTQISRMRIGIVEEVIGGRLKLRYEDSEEPNDYFWCHSGSPLIHHIGWSEKIGHRIMVAKKEYKNASGFINSRADLFPPVKSVKTCGFKVGMKLEAIDPLKLSCICVATVRKVLKNGYLMIGIDGSGALNGTDWFCYHCTSSSIFPVGFCDINSIPLSAPKSHKDSFSWEEYLAETESEAAPVSLFNHEQIQHGFEVGMKLEAVDLMEPRLLCVATVAKVVGRLLRIHFDGWDSEYDQWVDSQSSDIYPVGWCELVGYELQPPATTQAMSQDTASIKKKSKPKGLTFLGKKKRKRLSVAGRKSTGGSVTEETRIPTPPSKNGDGEETPTKPDPVVDEPSINGDAKEVSEDVAMDDKPETNGENNAPEEAQDPVTANTEEEVPSDTKPEDQPPETVTTSVEAEDAPASTEESQTTLETEPALVENSVTTEGEKLMEVDAVVKSASEEPQKEEDEQPMEESLPETVPEPEQVAAVETSDLSPLSQPAVAEAEPSST